MSRDDPIREYFEEDLPEKRFREQNERLQVEIDRNLGWDRDAFKKTYREVEGTVKSFGFASARQSLREGGAGIAFVRWSGCLWHLLVRVRVEHDREGRRLDTWAVSACGEEFLQGERVEGKVDTDPHRHLTCMECWEHVEALRVAQDLMSEEW